MRWFRRWTGSTFIILLIVAFVVAGLFFLWLINLDIPDFRAIDNRVISQSTKIYDRTGEVLLYNIHDEVKRRVVASQDISRHLKNAIVAIEDSEFYEHWGVKPGAIVRAFFVNLAAGNAKQGGSTITQQLIKNTLLTQEKSLARKIKEAVLAVKLERVMTKDQILTLYLNEVPFGGSIYGAEEAAVNFFTKHTSDLSLAEAAYLAAIPKAPTHYSPYGSYRSELDERKNLVLDRMVELNFIKPEKAAAAKAEKVKFEPPSVQGLRAPHFSLWVRDQLEEKYGHDQLINRGLKVITTIDWGLQQKAEAIVKQYAAENQKNFNASNAGLVALDPKTGQILAMVGSRDYFDLEAEGNFNIALAHRQPGSAFKPIVYAAAFNKGYTPETVVFDVATQFDTTCPSDPSHCYTPVNYDGKYRGPMTLREALAQSINIPAIKVLYLTGLRNAIQLAENLGITSLDHNGNYGLTLVLGGGEVSLLELTSAYSVFANDGLRNHPANILRVEDLTGQVLEEYQPATERALTTDTARKISSILSDNLARAPGFGLNSPLYFAERPVAAKTGTTNDYRDAWVIGYTPNLTVGAWAGNNDNTPMDKKVAGFIIAPMWRAFLTEAFKDLPVETFPPPPKANSDVKPILRGLWQGGTTYLVDKISGKLATEYTPSDTQEEKAIRQVHSILYWLDKDNPQGPAPVRPELDPQFKLWEEPVLLWASQHNLTDETSAVIPTASDDVHRPEFSPIISIISPTTNYLYPSQDQIRAEAQVQGHFPISQVDFFLNGVYLGSANRSPYFFTFNPSQLDNLSPENTLRVVAYDAAKNQGEASVSFHLTVADSN